MFMKQKKLKFFRKKMLETHTHARYNIYNNNYSNSTKYPNVVGLYKSIYIYINNINNLYI